MTRLTVRSGGVKISGELLAGRLKIFERQLRCDNVHEYRGPQADSSRRFGLSRQEDRRQGRRPIVLVDACRARRLEALKVGQATCRHVADDVQKVSCAE